MRDLILQAFGMLILGYTTPTPGFAEPWDDGDIVLKMEPCELTRSQVRFYTNSSKKLVFKGVVGLDGESYDVYLPLNKTGAYSVAPRPNKKSLLSSALTSTYLSVDQDHNGKIDELENYYSELPLRIGDRMFDVLAIEPDGSSITLRRSDSKLAGPALGRLAADFEFTATDGRTLRRDDFKGKTLVLDCWAPT